MKNIILILCVLLVFLPSCSEKEVDVEQEKVAIKLVIAKETQAWIDQDLVAILETLVQDENSARITIGQTGYSEMIGWDKIYNFYKKGMETDWSDFENMSFDHSNFKIHVCTGTALAMFDQTMTYYYSGELQETKAKEMRMLQKIKGQWKIVLLQWVDLNSFQTQENS